MLTKSRPKPSTLTRWVINGRFVVYAMNRLRAVQRLRAMGCSIGIFGLFDKVKAERLEDAKTLLDEKRRAPGA
jgi:hypothetical protein